MSMDRGMIGYPSIRSIRERRRLGLTTDGTIDMSYLVDLRHGGGDDFDAGPQGFGDNQGKPGAPPKRLEKKGDLV